MKEDVFRFDDFLKEKNELPVDSKNIRQIFEEEDLSEVASTDESEFSENSDKLESEDTYIEDFSEEVPKDADEKVESLESDSDSEEEEEIKESQESYYKLYSDKSEDFICDISIEGANPKETEARIVVESEDWTLMFSGEIKNGKCVVPIKKLNILKENQIGNIRLEVIAEGNLFVPWEDKFKVKLSKKVTVRVNEQKETFKKPIKNNSSVKVKVRK